MSKIVPFEASHIDLMDVRDIEKSCVGSIDTYKDRYKQLANFHTSWSLLVDGRIILAFGYVELWPGVLEVWVLPTIYTVSHPVVVARTLRRYILSGFETHGIHRIQSAAVDDYFHTRFMSFLGFLKEGTMEAYSADKRNYAMWAIVK